MKTTIVIEQLHKQRQSLRRRADEASRKRREIEQQIADIEAAEKGLKVGQTVEGWLHVGVKHPRWVKGTIAGFFFSGCDASCATLDLSTPVKGHCRMAFYLTSVRACKEAADEPVDMEVTPV